MSEDDLRAVKLAGYDDAQVIEIVLHVALNTWTNYINEVSEDRYRLPRGRRCATPPDLGLAWHNCTAPMAGPSSNVQP